MATTISKVSLKLLIDTNAKCVLFAEAGKDFIDFLFNLLQLPLGTVIRLLKDQSSMVGTLGNLYESIENLNETYLQPSHQNKDSLLKPQAPLVCASQVHLLLPDEGISSAAKRFYSCPRTNYSDCQQYVGDNPRATCPRCSNSLSREMTYVASAEAKEVTAAEGGFVKGVITYMVMDDLAVKPMSTISSITMLNKFNVKDVGALEERVVYLQMEEAVKLLKASLETKTVLTSIFLSKTDHVTKGGFGSSLIKC